MSDKDSRLGLLLLDDGLGQLVLGNRLVAQGRPVTILGNALQHGMTNADMIRFPGVSLPVSISHLQDAHGIAGLCLSNIGLDVDDLSSPFEYCDAVWDKDDFIYRPSSLDQFAEVLMERFPADKEAICEIFNAVSQILSENNKVFAKAGGSFDFKLYAKYFNDDYATFIKKAGASERLQTVLLTYAPWDNVSLITMAGYWGQISDISSFHGGYESFYNLLMQRFLEKGGRYIAHLPVNDIKQEGEGFLLETETGQSFLAGGVVYRNSTGNTPNHTILQDVQRKSKEEPVNRFGSHLFYFRNPEYLEKEPDCNVAYYRMFDEVDGAWCRFHISGMQDEYVKAEVVGPAKTDVSQIVEKIRLLFARAGLAESLSLAASLSSGDIERYTGIEGGCLYRWAHSVSEVKANPLGSLPYRDNVYFTGDWGNGFFYAAELYGEEILKKQKGFIHV